MPSTLSYEWFSIITTTMFSIRGSWSVPAAARGFGSSPGCSTEFWIGGGNDEVVVVDVARDEEPHAPRPAAAAPTNAPPSSVRREKAGVGLMSAP